MINPMTPPLPAIPSSDSFAAVAALLTLLADPAAAQARLKELMDAAELARKMIAELNENRAAAAREYEVHRIAIRTEREQFAQEMTGARDQANFGFRQREQAISDREAELSKLTAKAMADGATAAKLRSDLEDRLARVRSAAA